MESKDKDPLKRAEPGYDPLKRVEPGEVQQDALNLVASKYVFRRLTPVSQNDNQITIRKLFQEAHSLADKVAQKALDKSRKSYDEQVRRILNHS
jgi:hypothetical protein